MSDTHSTHSIVQASDETSTTCGRDPEICTLSNTPLDELDPYLVEFEPGDAMNPYNWSLAKRWYLTLLGGILVLNA